MDNNVYLLPNPIAPAEPVTICAEKCICCNACVMACRTQTIMKHPEKGKPPVVIYPDECWFCGCCVGACKQGAITMHLPINQKVMFKRKDTGEIFRIGADNNIKQTYTKPPIG